MTPRSPRPHMSVTSIHRKRFIRFVRPQCEHLEDRNAPALFSVQNPLSFSGLNNNGCVATADLNKDGFEDAILTNFGTDYGTGAASTITILYGKAGGGFNKVQLNTGGKNVAFVTIADINGDSWPDAVVANANQQNEGTVSVFKNDGAGNLSLFGTPFLVGGNNSAWVGLADVTGDNIPDAIVSNFGKDDGSGEGLVGNNVTIFQANDDGTGHGNFTFSSSPVATLAPDVSFVPTALAVADYNGDGITDIAAAVPGVPPDFGQPYPPGTIYVFQGTGSGGFGDPNQYDTGGVFPVGIEAADLNGDSKKDLIVSNAGDPNGTPEFKDNAVGVLLNVSSTATVNFGVTNTLTTNCHGTFATAVADFDLDGKQDIAAVNYGSELGSSPAAFVSMYMGNGSGSFTPGSPGTYDTLTHVGGGQFLAVGDFDSNGTPDLIVAHASNLVGLMLNTSTVAPTVTINQGAGQTDPTNSTSIAFDVVFSEGVTGFDGSDVDLSGSTGGGSGLTASVTAIDASRYTVTITGMSGTGLVKATIPAGAATSIASGTSSLASTSSDNQVTYDLVAPTVTINQASGQADPTTTGPIVFTVVFSENVTGFANADVDLSDSTLTGLSASVTQNTASNYTVSVTGMSGNGTVVAKVKAGAATDTAGNTSDASTSSDNTVTFGTVGPAVTINQGAGQADPTNSTSIVFDVVFAEGVSGFTGSDVDLTGSTGGGSGLSASVTPIDTSHYTVSVTGMSGVGTVVATIPAGAATSIASGSPSQASSSSDNQVNFDLVAPTVTINQASGQGDPTGSGPILFTVIFSEDVTGFTSADVNLSGSSLAGLSAAVTQNTPSNYTVSVTGMTGEGTVVANIGAGAATDGVGNASDASTSGDNTVTFDGVAPTVTIDQAVGQSDPTHTASVSFDVKFSEPVTGFNSADVSLAGSTAGGALSVVVTGSLDTYTVTVTGMTTDGTIVASIPAGGATDGVGNANSSSTSTDNSVAYVNTAGTIQFTQAVFDTTEPELPITENLVTITVSRVGGSDGPISIDYSVSDGTARSDGPSIRGRDDYTPVNGAQGTLNWADGEGGDKTLTIKILPDPLNEGTELVNLSLTNPVGNPLLGLTTAVAAIAPSDGQLPGRYVDQDGDKYTIKLAGKTGSLLYYRTDPDGDGRGPIDSIVLSDTLRDPLRPRASLIVSVSKFNSRTSPPGDGTVDIGAISGSGLRMISARKANLVANGVNLDGYLGALVVGNIEDGADITTLATTNPKQKTRINALAIDDGTAIDVGANISNLMAWGFRGGSITAPSVGTIVIRGNMDADVNVTGGVGAMVVTGNMTGDVNIAGTGINLTKKALNVLRVRGMVTDSNIMVTGNVGTVVVGSFHDSRLFAGYTGADDGNGTFSDTPFTVTMFRSTAATDAFENSWVIANGITTAFLRSVKANNTDHGGNPFGFFAQKVFGHVTVVAPTPWTYYTPSDGTFKILQDFVVETFGV